MIKVEIDEHAQAAIDQLTESMHKYEALLIKDIERLYRDPAAAQRAFLGDTYRQGILAAIQQIYEARVSFKIIVPADSVNVDELKSLGGRL